MKVLLINGSPHQTGCTYSSLKEVADTLNAEGVESEILWIGGKEVAGCKACGSCAKKGRCVIDDSVNDITERFDEFDGFVFGSPVYYSGPSGQICSWMDRFFYTNGRRMGGKVAASVVNARRGGNSASFERLNQYYLMTNMVVAGSQYWNMTHGNRPEEWEQDLEGRQTMRTLGKNIAWILKCIDAGKKNGVQRPEYEPIVRTNFIR